MSQFGVEVGYPVFPDEFLNILSGYGIAMQFLATLTEVVEKQVVALAPGISEATLSGVVVKELGFAWHNVAKDKLVALLDNEQGERPAAGTRQILRIGSDCYIELPSKRFIDLPHVVLEEGAVSA